MTMAEEVELVRHWLEQMSIMGRDSSEERICKASQDAYRLLGELLERISIYQPVLDAAIVHHYKPECVASAIAFSDAVIRLKEQMKKRRPAPPWEPDKETSKEGSVEAVEAHQASLRASVLTKHVDILADCLRSIWATADHCDAVEHLNYRDWIAKALEKVGIPIK